MFLDKLEWAGSSDRIEFHLATNRANDAFKDIATTLTSMLPNHWPEYRDEFGNMATRDQFKQWMAELGRLHDVNGFVVVARHASSGNNIIAVAIAEPNDTYGSAVDFQFFRTTERGWWRYTDTTTKFIIWTPGSATRRRVSVCVIT